MKKALSKSLKKYHKKFLHGDLRYKKIRIPKAVAVGVLGVICMYVATAGAISMTSHWLVRGDTIRHIDYVWRMYNGDIPTWEDGVTYPPLLEANAGGPQAAAAHPPLFYIIHAPTVGNLLEQGNWKAAIAVGRAINIFFGVLCIIAIAWGAWLISPNRKNLYAVAVPAISILTFRFLRLNIDYALDAQLVLFTTLTIIYIYKLFHDGPTRNKIVILTLLGILGMLTKATYIIFLAGSLLSVPIAYIVNDKYKTLRENIFKGSIVATLMLFAIVLASGWFYYYWNYKTSGSWFSPFPDDYTGGRDYKSLKDVLYSVKFWRLFYGSYDSFTDISTAIISFSVAGYLVNGISPMTKWLKNNKNKAFLFISMFVVFGTLATQIEHAVGYGSINFRYMLPSIMLIGLAVSYGLLQFHRTRGMLVVLASIALIVSTVCNLKTFYISDILSGLQKNELPYWLFLPILPLLIFGTVVFTNAIFYLTNTNRQKR